MKIATLILIPIVLFLFKFFYDHHIVERKAIEICEIIQIGDSYDQVLRVTSKFSKIDGQAYISEYTDGIYKYIYSNFPIKSIFYPQHYVCTAKFSDAVVIDKFVKFID